GIRDPLVTGVQTCALPILADRVHLRAKTVDQFDGIPFVGQAATPGPQSRRPKESLDQTRTLRHYQVAAGGQGCAGRKRVADPPGDRKSTRLNSSHEWISYA